MNNIPRRIHLCWFSGQPYPVEIKWCLESWGRLWPDCKIHLWTERDARALHCQYIDQALDAGKWAFAADAVRFFAVESQGGWYMDADLLLISPRPDTLPDADCLLFEQHLHGNEDIQAACFAGKKGNAFCRAMREYYEKARFVQPDGSYDLTLASTLMMRQAEAMGFDPRHDTPQSIDGDTVVMPGYLVTPAVRDVLRHPYAFARHTLYGSWVERRFFPHLRARMRHAIAWIKYMIVHLSNPATLPPHR